MPQGILVKAINERQPVEFEYEGTRCLVNPHILYHEERTLDIFLDGAQVTPTKKWRTFHLDSIRNINIQLTTSGFFPHPVYQLPQAGDPNIIAFVKIG